MTYTINQNKQFNSIEIAFDCKPSEAVRTALKELKFRWHKVKKVWYGYADEETIKTLLSGTPADQIEKVNSNSNRATPEEVRTEYAKIWDKKMTDYCTKKVAICVKLPGGELIPIEKQSIKKDFCFGESGYDYEDAIRSAAAARTNQEYFIEKNMEYFGEMLQDIEDHIHLVGDYLMTISNSRYSNDNSKIHYIRFEKITKILDDLGGSANIEELKLGQTISEIGSGRAYRIITDEEAKIILDAYKQAAAAHKKKVDSYLKRYGLSKVNSWTYWRDA